MKKIAPLLIILAGALWGTMGLFVRHLNNVGLQSMEISALRNILAAALLFPGTAIRNRQLLKIRARNLWPLICSGIFSIVFFNFCYFSTIARMSLSAAAILLYTAPIFVMLLSLLLFRERLTLRKILALILAFSGCCLVSGVLSAAQSLTLGGILLGLGSGFGYALYSIFSRFSLNQGLHSITITDYTFLFAALGSACLADFSAIGSAFASHGLPLLGFLILYCIVTTVLPYLLYTAGLSAVENGPASVLASVEPVMATLLGLLVFGETPTVSAVAGMVLVLSALVLLSLGSSRKEACAEPEFFSETP